MLNHTDAVGSFFTVIAGNPNTMGRIIPFRPFAAVKILIFCDMNSHEAHIKSFRIRYSGHYVVGPLLFFGLYNDTIW